MAEMELTTPDIDTDDVKKLKEVSSRKSRTERLSKAVGMSNKSKPWHTFVFVGFWIAALVVLIVIGVLTFQSANNQVAVRESQDFPEAEDYLVPGVTICDDGKYNLSGSLTTLQIGTSLGEEAGKMLMDPIGGVSANKTRVGVNFCIHFNTSTLSLEDSTDTIIIRGQVNGTDPKDPPQLGVYLYAAAVADSIIANFNPRDSRLSRFNVAVLGSSTYDYSVLKSIYVNPPYPPLADTTIVTFPGTAAFITAEPTPTPFSLDIDPSFEQNTSEQYLQTPGSAFYLVFSVVAGIWSIVTGAQEVLFPTKFPEGKREFRFGGKCSPTDMV